jgi:nucleotide-binding universal stress UspA family protein
MRIKRILAPTDLSQASQQGVSYAVRLARSQKAELILFFAEDVSSYVPGEIYGAGVVASLLEETRRKAENALRKLRDRYRRAGLRCRAVLVTGQPSRAIIETAQKLRVDWIVLATHGRGGVSHVLLGSVAERVVRSASCPVLTVRVAARRRPGRG